MALPRRANGVVSGLTNRQRAKRTRLLWERCARSTPQQPPRPKIRPASPADNALAVSISNSGRQLVWKTHQPKQFSATHFISLRIRGVNEVV
jgi:hypothetical protein